MKLVMRYVANKDVFCMQLGLVNETSVSVPEKSKKGLTTRSRRSKKSKADILEETGMNAELKALKGNQCLNKIKKQSVKKLRKKRKRSGKLYLLDLLQFEDLLKLNFISFFFWFIFVEKLAEKLSESLLSAVNLNSDAPYSFKTDFK